MASCFAKPLASAFAWEVRRSLIYSSVTFVGSFAALVYVASSSETLILFAGLSVAAFGVGLKLALHFRSHLKTIRESAGELLLSEQAKSKAAMEAQQYRRLASMGQLAAGIAHEINNPLSYVISNLEFATRALAEEDKLDPDILTALSDAEEGAERVRYIVRDIKTFSRPEETSSQHHLVDVNDVVASAMNIMRNQMRQHAKIETEFGEVSSVYADKAALGQVFVNLMANAAQSIEPMSDKDNRIVIKTEQCDDHVQVSIRDTGSGIDDSIRDKIFDPFFTSKPLGIGTGLGLSIVQQIIKKCQGTIDVESELGMGTTFFVRFPAVSEREEASATGSFSANLRTMVRVNRLLVVDDDRNLTQGLYRQFNKCDVKTVNSGHDALELLLSDSNFDVILCDLMMPGMTGPELYESVIAAQPGLQKKFVFMTGGAFTPQVRAFLDQDWVRCLSKPFIWTDLLRILLLPGTPEEVAELTEIQPISRASSQFTH
jgi:two-component system, cell cycle sensor histidine kinase and response regulator CckA